jgi:hypothetical protein
MRTPTTLILLILAMICPSGWAQKKGAPKDAPKEALGPKRLTAAFVHTATAADLAKGNPAKAAAAYAKEAEGFNSAQIRREIGMNADRIVNELPRRPAKVRLDMIAHLHMATEALTTNRSVTFEEVRKNIFEKMKEKRDEGDPTHYQRAARKRVEEIQSVLRAP